MLSVRNREMFSVTSNGNDIETKAERSFDLGFVCDIEAKRTCKDRSEANPAYSTPSTPCLFHKFEDQSRANSVYSWTDRNEAKSFYSTNSKERSEAKSVYSTNWTDRSEAKSFYSTNLKEAERSLFIPQIRKIEAERTWLIPEIGRIEAKKRTGSK
jgi:hypothetical protein